MDTPLAIKAIVLIINVIGIWLVILVNSRKPKSKIAFLFTLITSFIHLFIYLYLKLFEIRDFTSLISKRFRNKISKTF